MNVLIISDRSDTTEFGSILKNTLKDLLQKNHHQVIHYDMQKEDIHYCTGCFSCWVKTPGECIFHDMSREINQDYIKSDMAIMLSPVKYGCYTPSIRRALDRMLPNVLPFFKKINGEIHHAPRYDQYPRFVTIGYGEQISPAEEDTFRSLSDANALNFQANKAWTSIIRNEDQIEEVLQSFQNYIKE